MALARRRPARARVAALLLALLLALVALPAAPPARAAACVVGNNGAAGGNELRAALADAGCPTITFAASVAEVTVTTRLEIARDVTVRGPGAAVLAVRYVGPVANTGSVVWVRKGAVTLRGLTIAGGRTLGIWGAGLTTTGDLGATAITLDGVTVTDNVARDAGGGGVYASNAALTIRNSAIAANRADYDLSSPFDIPFNPFYGGAGLFLDDYYGNIVATVTDSVVGGNQASRSFGGGIRVWKRAAGRTATLTLVGTTVADNTGYDGGGLAVDSGVATLTNATVSGNRAVESGGGLAVSGGGAATLINVTVSGNKAVLGGGLYVGGGAATLRFATVTDNTVTNEFGGGGIRTDGGATTVSSSVVAGNRRGSSIPDDCYFSQPGSLATLVSRGRNLWGDRAGCPRNAADGDQDLFTLGVPLAGILNPALADNGGPTQIHALVAGSAVAIDRGDNAGCPATDQRGVARPQGAGCDSGAFEYQPPAPSPSPSPTPTPAPTPAPTPTPAPCGQRFGDVPAADPACVAIEALTARGIINGCDGAATPPLFCPDEGTLRHQLAALIVRAMPGWAAETWPNTFTDPTDDAELWRRVATLQHHGVVGGYDAASCAAQGKTPPCYGPTDPVLRAQAISFVTRAMVAKGYWQQQATNTALYGGALLGTGHEQDATTYWHYIRAKGGVPDYPEAGGFPVGEAAPRGWFARLLWTAIQGTPAAP